MSARTSESPTSSSQIDHSRILIGRVCAHLHARVTDTVGTDVAKGEEGELVIHGDNVMLGYWNLRERSAQAYFVDEAGARWY